MTGGELRQLPDAVDLFRADFGATSGFPRVLGAKYVLDTVDVGTPSKINFNDQIRCHAGDVVCFQQS